MPSKMKLVLSDGREFCGEGFGSGNTAVGEIVFNTSMVGYQEIISDPAYAGQIVLMTYPLMGQYGITDEDFEARTSGVAGLVVRECCDTPSNFRYTKTLSEELEDHGVPGISGLDTRMLTRIIRDNGPLRAAIVPEDMSREEALAMMDVKDDGVHPVSRVSCRKRWFSRTLHHKFDVVVVDCGIKHSMVKVLNGLGCNVTVVPFNATASDILAFNPDGVLLSSGPGDPRKLSELVSTVKELRGKLPVFGTGLGFEILGMACGAEVIEMKCGHHGGRPVRNVATGKIITVEHNHGYSLSGESIRKAGMEITYVDVADSTLEGFCKASDRICAVQFYPEGGPGPQESDFFECFIKAMED